MQSGDGRRSAILEDQEGARWRGEVRGFPLPALRGFPRPGRLDPPEAGPPVLRNRTSPAVREPLWILPRRAVQAAFAVVRGMFAAPVVTLHDEAAHPDPHQSWKSAGNSCRGSLCWFPRPCVPAFQTAAGPLLRVSYFYFPPSASPHDAGRPRLRQSPVVAFPGSLWDGTPWSAVRPLCAVGL